MDDKEKDIRGRNGTEALKKYFAEHPEGSRTTHGLKSRHVRKKYSDLRTVQGKALRDAIDALVEDLGGDLGAGSLLILPRVREKLITLSCIGEWLDRQPSLIREDGDLLPALKNSYLGYSESLRKDVEWLYSMASRRPSRVMDLEAYIKAKKVDGGGE